MMLEQLAILIGKKEHQPLPHNINKNYLKLELNVKLKLQLL